MNVYLHAKFEVSSIILASFRQGRRGNFTPPTQNKPLKSPSRLGRLGLTVLQLPTHLSNLTAIGQ